MSVQSPRGLPRPSHQHAPDDYLMIFDNPLFQEGAPPENVHEAEHLAPPGPPENPAPLPVGNQAPIHDR